MVRLPACIVIRRDYHGQPDAVALIPLRSGLGRGPTAPEDQAECRAGKAGEEQAGRFGDFLEADGAATATATTADG